MIIQFLSKIFVIQIGLCRGTDKLLFGVNYFGVKYPIILTKYSITFKNWGIDTQLINRILYLFQLAGIKVKCLSPEKHATNIVTEYK